MKERQPYSVGGKWRTGDRINEILFPCNDEVIARCVPCSAGGY